MSTKENQTNIIPIDDQIFLSSKYNAENKNLLTELVTEDNFLISFDWQNIMCDASIVNNFIG